MKEHLSQYNRITKIPDSGDLLLSNFMNGTQCILTPAGAAYLGEPDSAPEEFMRVMRKGGFVTAQDELGVLRERYYSMRLPTETLKLTVAPTMACNFACTYCFEHPETGKMSEKTQDELIAFTRDRLAHFGSKELLVAWYGGEPMICMDIIWRLSGRFIALCEELGVKYRARIVTNGWFFTQENAEKLEACRVAEAQITLDGTKYQHDRNRPLRSGGGTYDTVVRNLRSVRTSVGLNIRCNFHSANIADAEALVKLVGELRENGNNVRFEPARVVLNNYTDRENDVAEVSPAEYSAVTDSLITPRMPAPLFRLCATLRENSYAIDPKGYLFKCWEDIGRDDCRFGHITRPSGPETDEEKRNLAPFSDAPFPGDTEMCRDCVLLPVCMGGCPNARQKRGNNRCPAIRGDIDSALLRRCEAAMRTS